MRTSHIAACSPSHRRRCRPARPTKLPAEAPRTVRTVEVRYDASRETYRYFGTVQSRHEVDQAFRVGGKVAQRKVDVGDTVREGDVLAVLDDNDYRLAEETARSSLSRPRRRRARPNRIASASMRLKLTVRSVYRTTSARRAARARPRRPKRPRRRNSNSLATG